LNDANTQKVTVDLASVPKHVREELVGAVLDGVLAFLRQPGGRERLDEMKAERRNRFEKNACCHNRTGRASS